MRLIGKLDSVELTTKFCSFLQSQKIQCSFEYYEDPLTKTAAYNIWVLDEDDLEKAESHLESFKQDSSDSKFKAASLPLFDGVLRNQEKEVVKEPVERVSSPSRMKIGLTHIVIFLCAVLFFMNGIERATMAQKYGVLARDLGFTKVDQTLLFDFPKHFELLQEFLENESFVNIKSMDDIPNSEKKRLVSIDKVPYWKGVYPALVQDDDELSLSEVKEEDLFGKIKQGEVWRLLTPAFLHNDLFHIIFNMLWVWALGRQMEERIGKLRLLGFIVFIAMITNVCQYLMTGPFFMGFSGVICGMVGFIYSRQKVAPWEGYPFPKASIMLFLFFVLSLVGIEVLTLMFRSFLPDNFILIANTAHIVGGVLGVGLGRLSIFARPIL